MDYFFSTCDLLFYPQIVVVSLTFFLLIHIGKSLVSLECYGTYAHRKRQPALPYVFVCTNGQAILG